MKATRWFLIAVLAALLGLSAGSSAALSAPWPVAGFSPQDSEWVNGCSGSPLDWDDEQLGSAAFWRTGPAGFSPPAPVLP
jgi:hypothetical protein